MAEYICKTCDRQLPSRPTKKQQKAAVNAANAAMDMEIAARVKLCFDDEAMEEGLDGEDVMQNNKDQLAAAASLSEGQGDDDDDDEATRSQKYAGINVPEFAMVNGHFRGQAPNVLTCLNRTELNIINLISIISKITLLPMGGYYASHSNTVWSIVNKTSEVVMKLGMGPPVTDVALIRGMIKNVPKEFTWSPFKVYEAICWFIKCNFLSAADRVIVNPPDSLVEGAEVRAVQTVDAAK